MPRISLTIITKNEEKNIKDCILSASDVVDEIIIIDDFSEDATKSICESLGAKVFQNKFVNFGKQKILSTSKARYDWILSLDADERLSSELRNSISEWKNNPSSEFRGFTFNRLNHFGKKAIKSCGWYPDNKIRFWHKKYGDWCDSPVHEGVKLNTKDIGFLAGDLIHYTVENKEEFQNKINKYALLKSKKVKYKSKSYLFVKLLFNPISIFLKMYFIKRGILDGIIGFQIASVSAFGEWKIYSTALRVC